MPNHEIICVLGMHRSGTSLLTRLLNLLGVELGPNQFLTTEPLNDNPKGYWEHKELTLISDEILHRFGGRWDQPPTFSPEWQNDPALDRLKNLVFVKRAAVPADVDNSVRGLFLVFLGAFGHDAHLGERACPRRILPAAPNRS